MGRETEIEEGSSVLEEGSPKELYAAHLLGENFAYFRWSDDYQVQEWPVLGHVTPFQRNQWDRQIMEERKAAAPTGNSAWCYLIYHGPLGLYTNWGDFVKSRDEDLTTGGNSKKALQFRSVEEAKRVCQAIRDEEGTHWNWPAVKPIFWKKKL